ncbi:hypothetical protein KQX54_005518 [Cotesia glomerata]|uniref:Uncharacterized protein n=1 Tax=Cotesia glomerata TaxID=32391 RepID=A0AAV7ITQ5_COTGL|nr:hypothetical protein KQX54_005518 [Cotesia glomerata]
MENFDMKAFNDKILESLACLDKNIDIKKKPPTPGKTILRGVFFESNKIDDTQANQKKRKSREEKTAPNVKPMEEKLKGVLENLKARSKEIKPEKRTVKVIDVIQPALKKRKGSR